MFPNVNLLIGTQICGVIATITVLIFFCLQRKLNIRNEFYFLRTLVMSIVTCIIDIASIILNTYIPESRGAIIVGKVYLISMTVTLITVVLYLAGDTVNKKRYNLIYWVCTGLGTIVCTLMAVTSLRVVDIYTEGVSTFIMYGSAATVIIFITAFNIKYRKQMIGDKHNTIFIWMGSWLIFALLQFLFPKIILVSYGVTFGIVIIYIKLEALDNLVDKETGLFNWNSYLKYINNIKLSGYDCSIIYLRPNGTIYELDEKIVKESIKRFNEAIGKRRDIVTFSVNNEYILVSSKNDIQAVREFLIEKKSVDFIVGEIYTGYYIENALMIKEDDDLEPLVSYASNKTLKSEEAFITVTDEIIESYYKQGQTEKILQSAIADDRVVVYYQPIYSVEKKMFTSAEALVRIIDIDGKLIPPGVFIPVAEKNGMINELGKMVFEKVCRYISTHNMEALGLDYIEVNLSGVQLSDEKLADTYSKIMKKYGVESKYINLEITESANIEQQKTLKKNIRKFLSLGIKLSLDDYGTGYSNLNYLVKMPVSIIKFDKQMTDSFFEDNKAKYVMEYSIKMFKSLNLKIVIEGVETSNQVEELKKMSIDYIQGYFYSKPIDEESFTQLLS